MTTYNVNAGGNLQTALNDAVLGDTIVVEAGATFTGPFTFPLKAPGSGTILIRSSALASLPSSGVRVSPTDASNMPRLSVGAGNSVFTTATGAHHFQLIGIEICPTNGNFVYNLVQIGNSETSVSSLPNNFIFDRCYVHGDVSSGTRRGIAMNGMTIEVSNCYISDCKEVGADSQALACWNGDGPFLIRNNYLEAAGENVMFGGNDPSVTSLIPSNITFIENLLDKPVSWYQYDPSYGGTHWAVKNIFELKNAQYVTVQSNDFRHCWGDGQAGFGVVLTPRNQNGHAPWCNVKNVTIRGNNLSLMASAFNLLGDDDERPSGTMHAVLIENNLCNSINGTAWNGDGRFFQIGRGPVNVTIDHNTGFHTGNIITAYGKPSLGFIFRNNIAQHGAYGVTGDNYAEGSATLGHYFPGCTFTANVLVGCAEENYPSGNYFPTAIGSVGFVNYNAGSYALSDTSSYYGKATESSDIGRRFSGTGPSGSLVCVAT